MSHPILFKNLTDLQQILEIKKNFSLNKKPKRSKFENSMSKRGVKLKCLQNVITEKYFHLFPLTSQNYLCQDYLDKSVLKQNQNLSSVIYFGPTNIFQTKMAPLSFTINRKLQTTYIRV